MNFGDYAVTQELAILVRVGDNQICAASRRDSNWANVSKWSVFLSHQDRKDGRKSDLIIPGLVKRERILKQQVLLKMLAWFQRYRRNFRKIPAVGIRHDICVAEFFPRIEQGPLRWKLFQDYIQADAFHHCPALREPNCRLRAIVNC